MKTSLLIALLLVLAGSLLDSRPTYAYVTYQRLGYVSCAACHFDSLGGGTLTPYGESVEAAMSGYSQELSPDERKVYAGLQARVIGLSATAGANPFVMQGDLLATAFVTKSVHVDTQAGPNFREGANDFATVPSGWDGAVLRRALVTADLSASDSVSVGRDAAVGGLNIDDHTAFLRSENRRGVYDYPTQVRYLYQGDKIQILPYLAFPSFEEEQDNQEYGGGARAEYLLNSSNSVGATALYGNSAAITRFAGSVFTRLSEDHWNGLISEAVFTHYDAHSLAAGIDQQTFYVRPYIAIPEWIETSFVYEYLHKGNPFYETGFQYGPEINVRLHRFVSIIGDGRNLGINGNSGWDWYGQIFVHFQI